MERLRLDAHEQVKRIAGWRLRGGFCRRRPARLLRKAQPLQWKRAGVGEHSIRRCRDSCGQHNAIERSENPVDFNVAPASQIAPNIESVRVHGSPCRADTEDLNIK